MALPGGACDSASSKQGGDVNEQAEGEVNAQAEGVPRLRMTRLMNS